MPRNTRHIHPPRHYVYTAFSRDDTLLIAVKTIFEGANVGTDSSLMNFEWTAASDIQCAYGIRDLLRWAAKDFPEHKTFAQQKRISVLALTIPNPFPQKGKKFPPILRQFLKILRFYSFFFF